MKRDTYTRTEADAAAHAGGICECGCGGRTGLAAQSDSRRGHVKGQPLPMLPGHTRRQPVDYLARFATKIAFDDPAGCWIWLGGKQSSGYGSFWDGSGNPKAHRWLFEAVVGAVPDGLVLDHLCRVRHCVNPDHLEIVTQQENVRRGLGPLSPVLRMFSRTHCSRGHKITTANTVAGTKKGCRACKNDATRNRRRASRGTT